jgi:hypothetical protein
MVACWWETTTCARTPENTPPKIYSSIFVVLSPVVLARHYGLVYADNGMSELAHLVSQVIAEPLSGLVPVRNHDEHSGAAVKAKLRANGVGEKAGMTIIV